MKKGFAVPLRRVLEVIYGPEPVGRATAKQLSLYEEANLSGRSGFPHFNMKGDPALSFTGLAADPQSFIGGAQIASTRDVIVQDYPALPSEQVPPALPVSYDEYFGEGGIA